MRGINFCPVVEIMLRATSTAILSLFLAGCSPEAPPLREVDYANVDYKKGIYLYEETPFTGVAVTSFPGGSRHQEFRFQNGIYHGATREWNESGTLIVETHFESGKRHGKNTYWHSDGSLAKEQLYEHGKSISEKKYPPTQK